MLEDWGWIVAVENPALHFIAGSAKKVDTTDFVERLASALDEALRANPDVRQMRWWTEDELPRR